MRMSSTLLIMRSIRWRLGSSWETSFRQRWMQSWPEHHSFQAVPGGAWFSAPGGIGRLMGRDGAGRHHRSRRQDLTSGSEPRPHFEHGCSLQPRTLSSSCRTDAWDAAKHADAHVRVASRVPAWNVRIALGRPYAVETSPWGIESTRLDLPALDLQEDQGRLLRHLVARWAPMRPDSP